MPGDRSRILFVSRSAPPGVSGSAHVLKALLEADGRGRLVAVGGRHFLGARRPAPWNLELLRSELDLFGRGARFTAPLRELLKPLITRRLRMLAEDPSIASILCVFPDAFYCEASMLAARQSGKPLDLWYHNTYADNRVGVAKRRADQLERQMMDAARRLFFISDALRDRFVEKYPEIAGRSFVLRHPIMPVKGQGAIPRGFGAHPVRALMMGNLNESNVDAATRMLRALGGRDDLRISLCTPVPRALLAARGVPLGGVEYLGYLSDDELAGMLASTDLFLLPHGLTGGYSPEEYRTIFPTRAAHYLAQGRPVLAHCPADSGLARYLLDNECAEVVEQASEQKIVAAFERLVRDPSRQIAMARRACTAAKAFAPDAVIGILIGTTPNE